MENTKPQVIEARAKDATARRKFFKTAAAGAAGVATLSAPMISVAQSPIVFKM